MTLMNNAQVMAGEYGAALPRPRPFLETLRETLASFLVHFWLF